MPLSPAPGTVPFISDMAPPQLSRSGQAPSSPFSSVSSLVETVGGLPSKSIQLGVFHQSLSRAAPPLRPPPWSKHGSFFSGHCSELSAACQALTLPPAVYSNPRGQSRLYHRNHHPAPHSQPLQLLGHVDWKSKFPLNSGATAWSHQLSVPISKYGPLNPSPHPRHRPRVPRTSRAQAGLVVLVMVLLLPKTPWMVTCQLSSWKSPKWGLASLEWPWRLETPTVYL